MALSDFIPYSGQNGGDENLPEWMRKAIGNVGQIGPGAASYVSSSGPQEFSNLQKIFEGSLGKAQASLDPSAIKSLFSDSIGAAMKLGGEQINSAEGDRGAAVRPGGVAEQKMMDLGLKVQQPLVEALLGNMNTGLQFNQGALAKLFESASGGQSNSLGYRNTTQDINSQLPPYVQQSNPAAAGAGGDGAAGGAGGNGSAKQSPGNKMPGGSSGGGSGHYTGFDGYATNDPGLGGGAGYGSAPGGGQNNYTDFWNEPGYPSGPNEGAGSSDTGGPGAGGGLYDDADQPGGAADKSKWLNFGSAPNAGNSNASYLDTLYGRASGVGEWRPGVEREQWWGAY